VSEEVVQTTVSGIRVFGVLMLGLGFFLGFATCVTLAMFARMVLP
jgi:hypothetical protein